MLDSGYQVITRIAHKRETHPTNETSCFFNNCCTPQNIRNASIPSTQFNIPLYSHNLANNRSHYTTPHQEKSHSA